MSRPRRRHSETLERLCAPLALFFADVVRLLCFQQKTYVRECTERGMTCIYVEMAQGTSWLGTSGVGAPPTLGGPARALRLVLCLATGGNREGHSPDSDESPTMFSSAVQPALVSLFSSTGSDPLSLFVTKTDESLPSDSFVCLLNDSTSTPAPQPPRALVAGGALDEDGDEDSPSPNYTLDQTVLHIQSPTVRTTYIRCPPVSPRGGAFGHLGLKHPWVHLQVRNMGREWAFEVGIVDQSGREGVVRCATFQV